jgi:2-aminobenzoate-CoA ligase
MVKVLQDHVKQAIAPFKYPRQVIFTPALPKTQTGKIQRFQLRAPVPKPTVPTPTVPKP